MRYVKSISKIDKIYHKEKLHSWDYLLIFHEELPYLGYKGMLKTMLIKHWWTTDSMIQL